MGEFFEYLNTTKGATSAAVMSILILAAYIVIFYIGVKPSNMLINLARKTVKHIGKRINNSEVRYSRDIEIGKINKNKNRYKTYQFLNDLIIDLGLKRRGITPYEFLFLMLALSALISAVLGLVVLGSALMAVLAYPIITAAVICTIYTKANMAHDLRIDSVIEAENIICNNIESGVVVAVRNSLDAMPNNVKSEFKDFLDNMEHKNFHIRTALLDLNNNLGSISDEFISKCIMIETEEEHGVVGIFKDVVEINNIKTKFRTDMKKKFEEVKMQFIIAASTIIAFLAGVIAIFPIDKQFYLHSTPGQLLLLLDALIIIAEFVFITYLRAQEL